MKLTAPSTRIAIKNILVLTDFSDCSRLGLLYAVAVARRYDATLHVAHALLPEVLTIGVAEPYSVMPSNPPATFEEPRRLAKAEMTKFIESVPWQGVEHREMVCPGDVSSIISDLVAGNDVDLIVVGTHGRKGVGKLLMGSVAQEILHTASCPVLTVGPMAVGEAPREAEFRRILYVTDFSTHADQALPYALSLAQEHQASITLLHVEKEDPQVSFMRTIAAEPFESRLREMLPEDVAAWCQPEFAVEFGPVAATIVNAAWERHADLVVMGARGAGAMSGAATHFVGGVAYKVVCEAPCPVLTIRA